MRPAEQDDVVRAVPGYPADLARDEQTMGGATVHLRPIRPDDAARLVEFHKGLSVRSVYRRFFFVHSSLSPAEVDRFTHVDYVDRVAFVALDGLRLVAVGRYERRPETTEAEVAFVFADDYQRDGIGTLLLEHLAEAAWRNGITRFVAETLVENRDMLGVFFDSGFPVTSASDSGTISVRFPIESTDGYEAARATRHARSERGAERRDSPGPTWSPLDATASGS
ncbi:MAG: N-acetyltransferase family protein [Acidimicrobiales bacterium]|jgi:GNAT superfamily N-acetyltransferase